MDSNIFRETYRQQHPDRRTHPPHCRRTILHSWNYILRLEKTTIPPYNMAFLRPRRNNMPFYQHVFYRVINVTFNIKIHWLRG